MSANDAENSVDDGATFGGAANRQQGEDKSLGGEATFDGQGRRQRDDVSLGDERTLGGDVSDLDTAMDDIEIVDLASRYRTEGTLGRGGMGEVLLATDTRLDRKVAIKRILGEAARSRTAVSRFLTEAKSIAALNHPNIVQIYDYGRAADGPFLIMEYVDGSSLLERCRGEAIPLDEAVELACQLCDGLAKAHDLGIIHRDIKPANVLLTKDGTPKLTDFGLAKAEANDHGQTMTGAVLGTPDFMPPEQRRDAALVDARSDLWSLAATVYQMVTGKSPKIIRFKDVPETIQEVLGKALEDDKDARYQTVREFRDALKASLRAAATAAPVELGDGQCPSCGVKNDSSRKFCRGCGESLEAPCLSCGKGMPYWEEICGQCGTKQDALLTQRRDAMAEAQSKAETLLDDLDFQGAEAAANTLRDEPDLRLRHLVGWANSFLPKIEKSREEQRNRAAMLASEAIRHAQAFDYASAIHALEQVPASLGRMPLPGSGDNVDAALSRLTAKQAECQRLEARIKAAIAGRELAGLMPDVESLLRLRPDRDDVQKIKSQLLERHAKLAAQRDAAITKARQLLTKHEYSNAVAALSGVDRSVISAEFTAVLDQAEGLLRKVQHLRAKIKQAVADKRLDGLLPEVESLLELVPGNAEAVKLQESLIAREAKVAADVAAIRSHAEDAWKGCRFGKVKEFLSRIPERHRTAIEVARVDEAANLAVWQDAAANAVANVTDYDGTMRAVSHSKQYLAMLEGHSLHDAAALSALSRCDALRAKYEAEQEQAETLRRQTRYAMFAAVTAATLVAIGGAGVWIRGAIRRAEITRALEQKRWDDVIAMDATIPAAYIGRAQQRLTGDADSAMRDLDEAERRGGLRDEIEATRAKVYAARSVAYANADRVSDAASDLQEAKRRSNDDSIVRKACDALAGAWLRRSNEAIQAKRVDEAKKALDSAREFGAPEAITMQLRTGVLALAAEKSAASQQWLESAKAYDQHLALAPLNPETKSAAAEVFVRAATAACNAGDLDQATAFARRAIQAETSPPGLEDVRLLLGEQWQKRAISAIENGDLTVAEDAYVNGCAMKAVAADDLIASAIGKAREAQLRKAMAEDRHRDVLEQCIAIAKVDKAAARRVSELVGPWITWSWDHMTADDQAHWEAGITSLEPVENSIGMSIKLVPPGTFGMGSEGTYVVTITRPFYIGQHEVTNAQWRSVMGTKPGTWTEDTLPVAGINLDAANKFCKTLSSMEDERASRRGYRLPTEAEWEHACRAGTTSKFFFGDDESKLDEYAWSARSLGEAARWSPQPVGMKRSNPWGLYDMWGNVAEHCSDYYDHPLPVGAFKDPTGPEKATAGNHIIRGAACMNGPHAMTYDNRVSGSDELTGFRVVMVLDPL